MKISRDLGAARSKRLYEPRDLAKILALIEQIKFALLTTLDRNHVFHSRPVQTLRAEKDGTLWFFTDWDSAKAHEIQEDIRVSLGYANPMKHLYVVASGSGTLCHDPQRAKELWSAGQRAFYPGGAGDSKLAILRVHVERAEYWIAPGRLSYLVAAAKATITGEAAAVIGENRRIEDLSSGRRDRREAGATHPGER